MCDFYLFVVLYTQRQFIQRKLIIIPLHLLSRQVYGNMGSSVVQGSEVIEPEEWHHLAYRYDAQSKCTI